MSGVVCRYIISRLRGDGGRSREKNYDLTKCARLGPIRSFTVRTAPFAPIYRANWYEQYDP